MFTLLSGPFHPHLESKLVETVQQIKAADPRAPLAIVVPSESLRRRLQWLLCVEHGCALFDAHLLTFHQLALHVDAERRAMSRLENSIPSFELVGDFFFENLLSHVLQQDSSTSDAFALGAKSSGLSPALWGTIQDLKEAQVDPNIVLQGVQEGLFDVEATERLQSVFGLYSVVQTQCEQLGVGLPDDLTHSVIPWIRQSPFIAKLSSVFYYGFYDITQVQLSLLEEVARATSVTVFFPLVEGDVAQFAQRFLDRHLLKAGVVHQSVQDDVGASPKGPVKSWSPTIHVLNAVGPEGELTFACKAIMQHVEQMGYAWYEMGVVARNLEPYLPYFPRIFEAYHIPFGTTATRPLLEEPVAKLWWMLAGLRENQFGWRTVLDLVTSPWYRGIGPAEQGRAVNTHVWTQAVRHFRIVGGQEDWARLARVAEDSAVIQEWESASGVSLEQASESLQMFAGMVNVLIADCLALPSVGSISECTRAFERLLEKHLWYPTASPFMAPDGAEDERNECLVKGFEQAISSMQPLDRFDQEVTWEQWTEIFRSMLERTRLPVLKQTSMGVQILDVMGSRGRSYKALFVLGMNDHVFPRLVKEDAFLRDRDRKILAESLGFKIDEKMTGFDEEALLFALLQQSARDHVYFLYQRADGNGRPLIASSFLRDHLEHGGLPRVDSECAFPVGILERSAVSYFSQEHATLQEIRLRSVLEGRSIQGWVPHRSPWWELFQNGMEMMAHGEESRSKAGLFDGLTAVNSLHWQELVSHGFSPTALGTYAQCPMRYWMMHVLKIQRDQDTMSKELPGRVWGELVHQVLYEVYQILSTQGWPQQTGDALQLSELVNVQVDQVFQEYAQRFGKGYRLMWEWLRTRLIRMMIALLEYDRDNCLEQEWVPFQFEVEAAGSLPRDDRTSSQLLNLRGRFDRVDLSSDRSHVRIVDYKVSLRRSIQTDEMDLVTMALQGRQLQPPLYSFMTPINLQGESREGGSETRPIQSVDFRYLRPMQEESVRSASFSGAMWDTATGEQLRQTIHGWVQGIRNGQFFMLPGKYCRSCQYAPACRFQHHPSWSRAYGLPLAKTFRQFRKQKASHD